MLSTKTITLTTMREMEITTETTRTIIKGMMVVDTSARMTTTTDEDDFKVEVDILEIGKTHCIGPSSVIHVLMRGIDMRVIRTKTELI